MDARVVEHGVLAQQTLILTREIVAVDDLAEGMIDLLFVPRAAVVLAGAVLFCDHAVARVSVRDRVLPGDIEIALRAFADGSHGLPVAEQPFERRGHRGGVFLDEHAAHAVLHVLGGAAAAHEHAAQTAGGGLAHDETVGVEGGGEEEEVGAAVPGADHRAVADRRREDYLAVKTQ